MNEPVVIPDDLSACQALIAELAQTVNEQGEAITQLKQENAEQELTINELLQQAFRNRRERYLGHPDQMKMDFGDTPEAADAANGLAEAIDEQAEIVIGEHKRRKESRKKPRHEQLPEHLPRYEVILTCGTKCSAAGSWGPTTRA